MRQLPASLTIPTKLSQCARTGCWGLSSVDLTEGSQHPFYRATLPPGHAGCCTSSTCTCSASPDIESLQGQMSTVKFVFTVSKFTTSSLDLSSQPCTGKSAGQVTLNWTQTSPDLSPLTLMLAQVSYSGKQQFHLSRMGQIAQVILIPLFILLPISNVLVNTIILTFRLQFRATWKLFNVSNNHVCWLKSSGESSVPVPQPHLSYDNREVYCSV